jgi:oxygen-independent coproporphyrinogen-3 oxidase
MMTSLRTIEGCSYEYVVERFGDNAVNRTKKIAQHYIDNGQLMEQGKFLIATGQGKFFLDGIAADFFEV